MGRNLRLKRAVKTKEPGEANTKQQSQLLRTRTISVTLPNASRSSDWTKPLNCRTASWQYLVARSRVCSTPPCCKKTEEKKWKKNGRKNVKGTMAIFHSLHSLIVFSKIQRWNFINLTHYYSWLIRFLKCNGKDATNLNYGPSCPHDVTRLGKPPLNERVQLRRLRRIFFSIFFTFLQVQEMIAKKVMCGMFFGGKESRLCGVLEVIGEKWRQRTFSAASSTGAVASPSCRSTLVGFPISSDVDMKSRLSSTSWNAMPRFLPKRKARSMRSGEQPLNKAT